jgi:hypothetical protein
MADLRGANPDPKHGVCALLVSRFVAALFSRKDIGQDQLDLIRTDQVFAWPITRIDIGLLQPAERDLFRSQRDARS